MPRADRVDCGTPRVGIARLNTVAKMPLPARSVAQDPLELAHPVGATQTGERQRAPGDAQRHAERRLVGAVARDVADHHVHRPVRGLHEVVEIAAEQRILPAGHVPRDDFDAGVVQQQRGR